MTQLRQGCHNELARFFTQRQDCTTLRQDAHKLLLRAHNQGPNQQDYFIKIYHYPQLFHSRLKDWRFVGGGQEYKICKKLNKIGIPTPVPIGFAWKRNWIGIPKQSLYASLWLDDIQTVDEVFRRQQKQGYMDGPAWQHFVHELGQFLGRIHLLLVNPKDLNTKNILVQWRSQTKLRFILVDYERITFLNQYDLTKFMNPLSQVGASLLPAFEGDIMQLCEGYTRQVDQIDAKDLSQKLIVASWEKNRQWQREINGLFTAIGERLQGNDQTGSP